jgi:hypothetical protein
MPHYYFHVKCGQMTILDHEGIELAGTADAEAEAAWRALQVMRPMNKVPASLGMIIVADNNWDTLFEFPF